MQDINRPTAAIQRGTMSMTRYLCPALLFLLAPQLLAQSRPATAVELEQIRAAHQLDEIRDDSHYRVLSVEGSYEFVQGTGTLSSRVRFHPYLVQEALCLMEVTYRSASDDQGELQWHAPRYYYAYWKAEHAEDCRIESTSEIPTEAITTNDAMPTGAMVEIMYRADELLELALEYAINEADFESAYETGSDMPARLREMYREYRDGPTLRLRSVDFDSTPRPERGFAYRATFESENAREGPGVDFSLTADGFVIHGVALWIV